MTTKQPEKYTYKTTTVGDGGLYGWNKFAENGDIVESSTQTWNTEADAEKAIRALASKEDTVEVNGIKNINPDSNVNVKLVTEKENPATMPNPKGDEAHAGMEVVHESIEDVADDKKEAASKK